MKIKFNTEETIRTEYELDLVDSEKVIHRAKEMEKKSGISAVYSKEFWLTRAIQELLMQDKIVANVVHRESDKDSFFSWIVDDEEDS